MTSEDQLSRFAALMTDISARVVAIENLSLHVFADQIFKSDSPLAEIESLRARLLDGRQPHSKRQAQDLIDHHSDRMLALLEGVAIGRGRTIGQPDR